MNFCTENLFQFRLGDNRNQIRTSMLRGAAEYNTNTWVPYGSSNGGQGGGPLRREPQPSRSLNPYHRDMPQLQRYVLVPR